MTPEQFTQEYTSGFKPTVAMLSRKTRTPEDTAQAAWARAWEKREMFRAGSSFRTWVFAIAFNLVRDEYRGRRPEEQEPAHGFQLSIRSPEASYGAKLDALTILAGIHHRHADILRARYIEGRDHQGTAGRLKTLRARRKALEYATR